MSKQHKKYQISTNDIKHIIQSKQMATKAAPKLKLSYFNMAGLAEKSRLALALAKIPFEDARVAMGEEWQGAFFFVISIFSVTLYGWV